MQIGQGGSLPPSSGTHGPRADASAPRHDARPQSVEAARAAPRRVAPVASGADPASAAPRRNLPRGTLVNITV
jgi:hypothetical protein